MTARKGCSAGYGPSYGHQESYNLTALFHLFMLVLSELFFIILQSEGTKLQYEFIFHLKFRTVKKP